jgi:ribosome assembly protein 1
MAPVKTPGCPRGTIRGQSAQNLVKFTIRAVPLPLGLLDFLLDNVSVIKAIQHGKLDEISGGSGDFENDRDNVSGDMLRKPTVKPEGFWDALADKCKEAGHDWEGISDKIWAFGPQKAGGCLLVDARKTSAPQ